ncbi:unnamed protein product [Cylicocyclus nassatus]|uniref:Uncharacterized protein n=1 Tax=Cylicocyclus nassatus TaxID=53992 RepID=A0AA36GS92_CYLNA|nr:unnamed protein product [Cylicocyclus nassatus]
MHYQPTWPFPKTIMIPDTAHASKHKSKKTSHFSTLNRYFPEKFPIFVLKSRMHYSILAVLILTADSVSREPFDDHARRAYASMITLPYDPSMTKSQKMKECHKLDNVDAEHRSSDVSERQLCEHIIKFNDWLAKEIEGASEKVRDVYDKTYVWTIYKEQKLEDPLPEDNLPNTLDDLDRQEFENLEDRIAKKVDADKILQIHRFSTIAP